MYILNIFRAIRRCWSTQSEALSLKIITNELVFLRETVTIQ